MLAVFRNLSAQPAALLQRNAIYPLRNTLTYAEPLVVPALVAGPVFQLTGNLALAAILPRGQGAIRRSSATDHG